MNINRKAKEVIFCFENLEQISIPASMVEMLFFNGVHRNISLVDGVYHDMTCCEEALVVMKPDVDKVAVSTFDLFSDIEKKSFNKISLTDRLSLYDDCVGIDILFSDDSREEIYVPWEDREHNEFQNALQSTFIQKDGNLRGEGGFCVHFGTKWTLIENPVEKLKEVLG